MIKMKRILILFLIATFIKVAVGCKKLVVVSPPTTSLTSDNIYSDDATAASVLTGLYTGLGTATPLMASSISSIFLISGLSADELTLYGGSLNANSVLAQYYLNRVSPGLLTTPVQSIWSSIYFKLYTTNIALERLSGSKSLTPAVKQQLIGEAKFLRAFFYFYLTNLYGNAPLVLTSDYRNNSVLSRSPVSEIYLQIIADLKDAQAILSDSYMASDAKSSTVERVRPTKWAATALLARSFLYAGKYDSAELEATAVINNTNYFDTVSSNNVFLKNSKEAIWQLQPVNAGWNTEDARVFILPSTGPTGNSSVTGFPVYISPQLLNSFEPGDRRRVNWIDSVTTNGTTYFFPFKYKSAAFNAPVTEYMTVLRLGEQYLIRAEARARRNNINGAKDDLNTIRSRAGLQATSASDQTSLLSAILHERQVELFTEWGHRWLDLKRTGAVDTIMDTVAAAKGSSWDSKWQWYPLPAYDIVQDPHLEQNTGY